MFLNPWSIALWLLSGLSIFLIAVAAKTAVRVIRYWQPEADSQRQISLETEIWLSSTLVQYALAFQIVSLFLYVLAADHFSHMLAGAMCATGSLLANSYGVPLLIVKIIGVFLYGLWIVVHQLDISSEEYPLVRLKYVFLLLLLPLLVADMALLVLYLSALEPDIITSCCAIIFDGQGKGAVSNLLGGAEHDTLLIYYGFFVGLLVVGCLAWVQQKFFLYLVYGVAVLCFFVLALATITTVLSSFIYAMPFHNCPFCILKGEYGYIGFFMYVPLFVGVFCGATPMLVQFARHKGALAETVSVMQRKMVGWSVLAITLHVALSSYHYVVYTLMGGE